MAFRSANPLAFRIGPALGVAAALIVSVPPAAADDEEKTLDVPVATDNPFADLDLASLLDVRVVTVRTVTGTEGRLFETPAAVTVLEAEDLERSVSTYLPDVLRIVPGLEVQRVTASRWAISARGFATTYADKMQVLLDGRTLYDPAFSGTIWELMDRPIDEIDRVEVIRGPGAVLWGENAVNGVINFESKSAFDTIGLRTNLVGGTAPQLRAEVRYGFRVGEDAALRIWGMGTEDDGHDPATGPRYDDWASNAGGFRFDRDLGAGRSFELQGDYTINRRLGEQFARVDPSRAFSLESVIDDGWQQAANVRFRLEQAAAGDDWYVQGSLDRTDIRRFSVRYQRHAASLEARRFRQVSERLNLGAGFGITALNYVLEPTLELSFRNSAATDMLFSGFAQAEWAWIPDELTILAGAKASYNDYTGSEIQPNVRLAWTPDEANTIWGSVSRSVSAPTARFDTFQVLAAYADAGVLAGGAPNGSLVPLFLQGSPNIEPEEMIGFELGWRTRPHAELELSVASFFNRYDRLIQFGPLVNGGVAANGGEGDLYGGELSVTWRVTAAWKLAANASFLFEHLDVPDGTNVGARGNSPEQRYAIRSTWNLDRRLRLDGILDWQDDLRNGGEVSGFGLDVGLTWTPRPGLEIFVHGRDLLDRRRREAVEIGSPVQPAEIERSVVGGVRVEF